MTGDGQQQEQSPPSSTVRLDQAIARSRSVMLEREPALSVGREQATRAGRAAQMTRQRLREGSAAMQAVERRARLMVSLTKAQIKTTLLKTSINSTITRLFIYIRVYRNIILLAVAAFFVFYYWSDIISAIEFFKVLLEERLELLVQ